MPRSILGMIAVITLLAATQFARAEVRVAPIPDGETPSKLWRGEIQGRQVDAYAARTADPPFANYNYGGEYAFLQIDADEPVNVKLRPPKDVERLTIRPLSYGVEAKRNDDGDFEFTLPNPTQPRQISIETNGREHPLLLFLNRPELNPPQPNAQGIIYFGKGVHRPQGGIIRLRDNDSLYLAPGAVVHAGIIAQGENITIYGRGVLDSSEWEWRKGPTPHVVSIERCKNVLLEGVVIRGASHWTVVPIASENVVIENIKLCGGRVQNDDGINPCNSRNVTVAHTFIRTDDDCMALKGLDVSYGDCEDITVENCVFWCDRARIVLMVHESRANYMRRITFRNIDVIHSQTRNFLLEPGEKMRLEDVLFENIRFETGVENALSQEALEKMKEIDTSKLRFDIDVANKDNWLFVGRPVVNQYMKTKEPGYMKNIVVRNISVEGPLSYCGLLFSGADAEHRTEGLTVENVSLFGEKVDSDSSIVHIGEFIDDVTVK